MTQIKILDREKDYLLNVNPYQFVDSLDSASIFYELLSFDKLATKRDLKDVRLSYNNISLVGIYNGILNVICHNLYEALVFRHHLIYKKQDKQIDIRSFGLHINNVNFQPDKTTLEYEYLIAYPYRSDNSIKLFDSISVGNLKLQVFEHTITIWAQDMPDDFLPKMLILYQDFTDNIPI